jgi:ribosomal protein S18 acetylase RimI-like enzyme
MPGPDVELIRSDDGAWDDRLAAVADDIYHSAGYHRFTEASEGGEAFLAVISESRGARGVLWPYLLRPVGDIPDLGDAEGSDVDSVYGYPGPLAWGCEPGDAFMRKAADALVDAWREQGAVTAFTRFHPLLENVRWGADLPALGPGGSEPVLELGETVAIDLRQEDAAAVAAYSKTLRQEIASARRAGMASRLDEDWSALGIFAALYRATMIRTRAAATYFFSVDDFRALKEALGNELHLFVTEFDGKTAATGLFTEHRGIVQAHLVGTDDDFREWSPLKVLLDDVRRWAAQRNNDVLHLGGGRGGRDDSLLAFKRRFSPQSHRFSVGRWVLDTEAYARLTSTWRKTRDARSAGADASYFPAYRSPLDGDEVEFRLVTPQDRDRLADVFADIDNAFFRPHPFTADEARKLASYSGRDVYAILMNDHAAVAYGMLRGWDEGYETPSLGIAVRRTARGKGFGRRMMNHLHAEARRRGAEQVRLRVHPENVAARRLYESLGYIDAGEERGELVMVVDLRRLTSETQP